MREYTRNHDRSSAGFSLHSHRKHFMLDRATDSQAEAWFIRHPRSRTVFIDMRAGDGEGIELPQRKLFGEDISEPSPVILATVWKRHPGSDLIVCERDKRNRARLAEVLNAPSPRLQILKDNNELLRFDFRGFDWALVIDDPCGYKEYSERDLAVLRHIRSHVKTDMILIFNQKSWKRIAGMRDEPGDPNEKAAIRAVRKNKLTYLWMEQPGEWLKRLDGRFLVWGPFVGQSGNYGFRLVISADGVGDYARKLAKRKGAELYDRDDQSRPCVSTPVATAV